MIGESGEQHALAARVVRALRGAGYEARVETADRVRFYGPNAEAPSFVHLRDTGFTAENAGLKAIRIIREALEGAEAN